MKQSAFVLTAMLGFLAVAVVHARTWNSRNGKFSVEAEMTGFEDGKVLLRKEDSSNIAVPLEKLSATDQRFVRKQLRKRPADANAGSPQAPAGPVMFTAMGCGLYEPQDESALARYIKLENQHRRRSEFIVHLGDIMSGARKDWGEAQYRKVALLLSSGNRITTFVVPGDNEWNDLADPDRGWRLWTKYFLQFGQHPTVTRQQDRTENFAFVLKGVLFIGINQVGGAIHDPNEWSHRLNDNTRWISQNLENHKQNVRAAVIFAQAAPEHFSGFQDHFLTPFRDSARTFSKLILYLHADGHVWFVKEGEWEPNIVRVQLDKVNTEFPPVQIMVTTNPKPFQFDRRLNNPLYR